MRKLFLSFCFCVHENIFGRCIFEDSNDDRSRYEMIYLSRAAREPEWIQTLKDLRARCHAIDLNRENAHNRASTGESFSQQEALGASDDADDREHQE